MKSERQSLARECAGTCFAGLSLSHEIVGIAVQRVWEVTFSIVLCGAQARTLEGFDVLSGERLWAEIGDAAAAAACRKSLPPLLYSCMTAIVLSRWRPGHEHIASAWYGYCSESCLHNGVYCVYVLQSPSDLCSINIREEGGCVPLGDFGIHSQLRQGGQAGRART